MDTKSFAQIYFESVTQGTWEDFIVDDFVYGFGDSQSAMLGKEVYLKGARSFYALSKELTVQQLFVEGLKVAAVVRYQLLSPAGKEMALEVAEFLTFNDEGKLLASTIYFDTQRFQEFMKAD